jgi:hypothetical protein
LKESMMKHLFAIAFALGAALAGTQAARAATPVLATAIVETPHAVFFQPVSSPNVVWYFTKSDLKLTVVDPVVPSGTYWRAAVVLERLGPEDLAALPEEWTGKSIVPYIVRPTTECTLTKLDEMRFVVQEIRALNHDITPANPTSVCRFTYRLPTVQSPDLQARLAALVADGTLIKRDLHVDVRTEAKVAWADVHAAVAAALAGGGESSAVAPAPLSREDAEAAIATALASPALAQVAAAITEDEKTALVAASLSALFTANPAGTEYHLVTSAPSGTVVYHQETFSRAM